MTTSITVRPRQPSVTGDDPFADDELDRQPAARILTEFVSRLNEPYVIAIDSPWGTGKTTFIEMWQAHLQQHGFKTLLFNAWESDFTDDPFTALVGEFSGYLKTIETGNSVKLQAALDKTKKAAISVAKRSIPVALKLATAGLLDLEKVFEDSISLIAEGIAKDAIETYTADKDALEEFRTALSDAAEAIQSDPDDPKPLIFIIDELDRCRPSYALSLLERAKHLFNISGIVFVLAIDRSQLEISVRSVYGSKTDATGYLRRFIDTDYRLPPPNMKRFTGRMLSEIGIDESLRLRAANEKFNRRVVIRDNEFLSESFTGLCEVVQMSLRAQIQCTARLGVILRTIPHRKRIHGLELGILTVLREWRPDLYSELRDNPRSFRNVLQALNDCPDGSEFLDSHPGRFVEAALAKGAEAIAEDATITQKYRDDAAANAGEDNTLSRAADICTLLDYLENNGSSGALASSFERIEMASGFFSEDYEPDSADTDEDDSAS